MKKIFVLVVILFIVPVSAQDIERKYDFDKDVVQLAVRNIEFVDEMPLIVTDRYGTVEPRTCYTVQYMRGKYLGLGVERMPHPSGFYITNIGKNSSLLDVGVERGEIIYEVDGVDLSNQHDNAGEFFLGDEGEEKEMKIFNLARQTLRTVTVEMRPVFSWSHVKFCPDIEGDDKAMQQHEQIRKMVEKYLDKKSKTIYKDDTTGYIDELYWKVNNILMHESITDLETIWQMNLLNRRFRNMMEQFSASFLKNK